MVKSWFYLTLWKGTPTEFTDYIDAQLGAMDSSGVAITTTDRAAQNIERMTSGDALIDRLASATADITARTEVVWNVG